MANIIYKKPKKEGFSKEEISMLNPTHSQIQCALITWAQYHPICCDYLFHIPNEGKRSRWQGMKLKDEGLKPGVADLFLSYPSGIYHGYYIEIKTEHDELSAVQKNWKELVTKVNYKFSIIRNVDAGIRSILEYLGERIVTRTIAHKE